VYGSLQRVLWIRHLACPARFQLTFLTPRRSAPVCYGTDGAFLSYRSVSGASYRERVNVVRDGLSSRCGFISHFLFPARRMAIFGNKKDKSSNSSMATQGNRQNQSQFNIVGEGTVFEGTLRAESNVNVSGRVVGKLIVNGRAVISKNGRVEGELRATNAAIGGTIEGEVYVEERLELESTAHVDGSIQTDRLIVEEGAVFTGACKMGDAIDKDEIALPPKNATGSKEGGSTSSGSKSSGSTSSGSSSKSGSGGASSGKGASGAPAAAGSKK